MSAPDSERDLVSNRNRAGRWAVTFPYGWDADELVARRQLLRWAVMASGALFAATGVLAGLGYARDRKRGDLTPIVAAADVPVGGVHYFNYPGQDDHAILLRLDETQFVAYSGKCTHLSCAVYWKAENHELRCPCHDGVFEPETGDPIAGPPQRPLPRIELREQDGVLYAEDEVVG
jgi:Rieske Fe-S protein